MVEITELGRMETLPDCPLEGCVNKIFTIYNGKWVCGDCLIKLMEIDNNKKWDGIKLK